jgi:Domain of unknown function (DUF4397)
MRNSVRAIALIALASIPSMTACENGDDSVMACESDGALSDGGAVDSPADGADATHPIDASGTTSDAPIADAGNGGITDARGGDASLDAGGSTGFVDVRFANWSSDAPSVDFCLAAHGSGAFRGPIVAGLLAPQEDAGALQICPGPAAAGVCFPQTAPNPSGSDSTYFLGSVSSYSLLPALAYDVRLVAARAVDCTTGLISDQTLPALSGAAVTVALIGEDHPSGGAPGLRFIVLHDDVVAPAGKLALRFLHASPGIGPVDFGTGSAAAGPFKRLFLSAAFGMPTVSVAADAGVPAVDSNGYISVADHPSPQDPTIMVPPLDSTGVSVRLSAGAPDGGTIEEVAVIKGMPCGPPPPPPNPPAPPIPPPFPPWCVATGSVVTIAFVGTASTKLEFVECIDNAGTTGAYSNCSLVTP